MIDDAVAEALGLDREAVARTGVVVWLRNPRSRTVKPVMQPLGRRLRLPDTNLASEVSRPIMGQDKVRWNEKQAHDLRVPRKSRAGGKQQR